MKRVLVICVILLIGVFIFILWFRNGFTMFEVQEETLFSHQISGQDFKIEVVRVTAGATTTDGIQIRKVFARRKYEIVKAIDDYDSLISSQIVDNKLLRLIVRDLGYWSNSPDTIQVRFE